MTEEEEARDAIVDVAITMGKAKDRTNDIHTPPARQVVLLSILAALSTPGACQTILGPTHLVRERRCRS